MSLLQKINLKALAITNAQEECYRQHREQQKQYNLTFLAKLVELYYEIKELNGQKIRLNWIYHDTGYDPRLPERRINDLTLKVELLDTHLKVRLMGWILSHGHISIRRNYDNDSFIIEAWGFNKQFKNRHCSTVDKAKEEIVDILSNLNEF